MRIILIPNAPRMTARHYCLAKALVAQGHDVHYVMWDLPYTLPPAGMLRHVIEAPKAKTYRYEAFTMHSFRRLPFFWPMINNQLFKRQLRRLFHTIKADIIFSESFTNETEVPKDLPFIYDLADDYYGPADVFGSKIYKLAFGLLDVKGVMRRQSQHALAVTAVSRPLLDFASKYNQHASPLPNGVNATIIRRVLKTSKPVANPHSLVYASGFGRWSRVIETMQAVTQLRSEFPDLTLTLLGDGTEVDAIKAYIADNQAAAYIDYAGFVADQTELFSRINQHTIGLNVSERNSWRDASFPMKVIDYSALGMPVLSTDLPEVKNLKNLNFKNIRLFSNDHDGFVTALRKALHTKANRADYRTLSQQVLRDYDWDVIASKLVELSEKSLKHRAEA